MLLSNNWARLLAALCLFVAVVIAAFFANEARKEVVYLCGNFVEGVPLASVIEQLDTANLSTYRVADTPVGQRIEFDSALNFRLYRCIIELDSNGTVEQAGLE